MEIQNFLNYKDINSPDTPFLIKEYKKFKEEYPDFILFVRVGDFYETYFDDAVVFSNTCSVVLTKRTFKIGNVLMAGVSKRTINTYVEKMISAGFKAAIIEQTENKNEEGKLIRKVTKTYTRGCLIDFEFLNPKENNYLLSVYKKEDIYQIAYADISGGEIYKSSGTKREIECEIARISPKELLLPKNQVFDESFYKMFYTEKLNENFYKGEDDNLALVGLINYTKFILREFYPQFNDIKEYEIKKTVLMDYQTRKNLEIIRNSYNKTEEGSLLWVFDKCKTPMGKRLLNSILTTPLYDLEKIKIRQESISKLLKNKELVERLSNLFENKGDIARISTHIANSSIKPYEFLTIKKALSVYAEIENIRQSLNLRLLKQFKFKDENILTNYYQILDKTFEDDIEKVKAGNYIKNGANYELDFARENLTKCKTKLEEYQNLLIQKTRITSLKITKGSGEYFIEINTNSENPTGDDFVIIKRSKKSIRYTTSHLLELEKEIFSNEKIVSDISENIYKNLIEYSKEIISYLKQYSKIISVLDVLCAFCKTAHNAALALPNIKDEHNLYIENLRHLPAEKIIGLYEALNLKLEKNFAILTGKNGIGKSTLLKAIGSIIVLAQSGFYVPALRADLPFVDKIFAILNVGDEIINKKSTHQMQMHLLAETFENMTDKSLVLLDEIGKHTNYKDGFSIAAGCAKYGIKKSRAKFILATHFLEIGNFLNKDDFDFLKIEYEEKRTLNSGIIKESSGIEVAKSENLPCEIINFAKEIYNVL